MRKHKGGDDMIVSNQSTIVNNNVSLKDKIKNTAINLASNYPRGMKIFIIILATIIATFFIVLLAKNLNDSRGKRLLLILLVTFFFSIIGFYSTRGSINYKEIIGIHTAIGFIYGMVLYFSNNFLATTSFSKLFLILGSINSIYALTYFFLS